MSLPILTTAEDVREIVRYLKNKPTGATLAEAKSTVKKQVLDPRKMTAYQAWGFVGKEGDRIKLTPRGWDYARKPDSETDAYKRAIDGILPYKSVLEWAHHQGMNSLTNIDVASQWHEHHSKLIGTENENSIKDSAVCFFHVAQAAELGKLILGRKGQATRLELHREQLEAFIEAGPSSPPWNAAETLGEEGNDAIGGGQTPLEEMPPPTEQPQKAVQQKGIQSLSVEQDAIRVFVSHGSNMDLVDQVQTMLELGDIKSEVAVKEESSAIPVPEKIFGAMRRCTAGIIVVSVDETRRHASGDFSINENVLIEIGAAFVLYDKKVVLLWDKRLQVPSNLQGLYRCEFEGKELSWSSGMKLMKAIRGFKSSDPT